MANRIFTDQSIVVKDTFKENVSEFFSSDVVDVDFANQREDAINYINNWCSENTNNKIPKILFEGLYNFCINLAMILIELFGGILDDVDFRTKMILTNAVYLNACWLQPFYPGTNKPFFIDKDTTIDVPTMHQHCHCMYKDLKRWNAECIAIPYRVNYTKFYLNQYVSHLILI